MQPSRRERNEAQREDARYVVAPLTYLRNGDVMLDTQWRTDLAPSNAERVAERKHGRI
jgi:hypothetical protein